MGAVPEEAGHRPSACIRVDLGPPLRPLSRTSLVSGDRPWVGKRPWQQAPRGGFGEGRRPGARGMGAVPEEAGHRPSPCIRVDLGPPLRPLSRTCLVSGDRPWVGNRPWQQAPAAYVVFLALFLCSHHTLHVAGRVFLFSSLLFLVLYFVGIGMLWFNGGLPAGSR